MVPSDRIHDDLKGLIQGEMLFDDTSLKLYSTDASIFQLRPAGIICPANRDELQTLVHYAHENEVPLSARGAGTGLAGESLGTGILVDLSHTFREIVDIGTDTVRVQAGVILRHLRERLAREGRRLACAPDFGECTLGGTIATNASGSRACHFGYLREHVQSLEVVFDNGERLEAGRHAPRRIFTADAASANRLDNIVSSLVPLLQRKRSVIQSNQPRTPYNRCGYLLHDILQRHTVDLAKLLTGSEGTLGFVTEATLRTQPLPGGRGVALFGFATLDTALKAADLLRPNPMLTACELIERRLVRLATDVRTDSPNLSRSLMSCEAVLIVEFEADSQSEAQNQAREADARIRREERLATLSIVAEDEQERANLWKVREAVLPSLYALRGTAQPVAFLEDVAVPVEELPRYLLRMQELLQRFEITASYFVHAATGQVHMRPFLDLRKKDEVGRMWNLADEVYSIVLEVGGTISTQHGVGLARTPWMGQQYGPLLSVFREVKSLFDPKGLLNPGKIVRGVPGFPIWPVRPAMRAWNQDAREEDQAEGEKPEPITPLPLLAWSPEQVQQEIHSCNGCAHCRTDEPSLRMCPLFRTERTEAASPRAKANLLRNLLESEESAKLLSSSEVREVADLCVNCKMCAQECPARVNIPKLMLEAKAQNVAEQGLDRESWLLARVEGLMRWGSLLAPLTNLVLGGGVWRWLLDKVSGLSRHRRLPSFVWRSFLRRARKRGWTNKPHSGKPRVAYFVDVYANFCDPDLGEAVVSVLHHQGIEVYVPWEQYGCGMAPLAVGDVETARETLEANLRVFADLAREGFTIVCSEPTAALMMKHDALDLLDDDDARLVAEHTIELTSYLWALHERDELKTDFQPLPMSLGHHIPCHVKALGTPAGPRLLSLIPQLSVQALDLSCSGMAGTYGLRATGYETSQQAGAPMLEALAQPRHLFGVTECSSCRIQMEDSTNKRTLHPAHYLALAYGLMPEIRTRLERPLGRRLLD